MDDTLRIAVDLWRTVRNKLDQYVKTIAQLQATIKDRDLLIACIKDVADEERHGKNTTGHTLTERLSFLLGDIKTRAKK